jgi:DNA invertase Pin-like site-specific DNA recombinase
MRVIGYVRVSTDQQANEGVSLDAQAAKIRAYCDLYGLELAGIGLLGVEGLAAARAGLTMLAPSVTDGHGGRLLEQKRDLPVTQSMRVLS